MRQMIPAEYPWLGDSPRFDLCGNHVERERVADAPPISKGG